MCKYSVHTLFFFEYIDLDLGEEIFNQCGDFIHELVTPAHQAPSTEAIIQDLEA